MMKRLGMAVLLPVVLLGCGFLQPAWHDHQPLRHVINGAALYDGILSVHGEIYCRRPLAFSDYGIKVHRAVDDTGYVLELKSVQVFWMKGMYFEIELSEPRSTATEVSLDLSFVTRTGLERITNTYPIRRNPTLGFWTQHHRWDRDPNTSKTKKNP